MLAAPGSQARRAHRVKTSAPTSAPRRRDPSKGRGPPASFQCLLAVGLAAPLQGVVWHPGADSVNNLSVGASGEAIVPPSGAHEAGESMALHIYWDLS